MRYSRDNQRAAALIDAPHNPASCGTNVEKDVFYNEYAAVLAGLRLCLLNCLRQEGDSVCAEHCFGMATSSYGSSRFVDIEVWSRLLWQPRVVFNLWKSLQFFDQSYMVEFTEALDSESIGLNFAVISKEEVVGYFSSEVEAASFENAFSKIS